MSYVYLATYVSSSMYFINVSAFLWRTSRNWARNMLLRDNPGFSWKTWKKENIYCFSLIKLVVYLTQLFQNWLTDSHKVQRGSLSATDFLEHVFWCSVFFQIHYEQYIYIIIGCQNNISIALKPFQKQKDNYRFRFHLHT